MYLKRTDKAIYIVFMVIVIISTRVVFQLATNNRLRRIEIRRVSERGVTGDT